ncbi:MAG: type III pantothenate kinase [Lewinellaceae bacterium]|nr:type III pantothenate kinase [Lewinellaceae bacterium]
MNLVLDIGNTRTKSGLFEGERLVEQAIWDDWTLEELLVYGQEAGVDRVITSSVAVPDPYTQRILVQTFPVALELTHQTPVPFRNTYRTPETLGRDRLAGVAGAQVLFPGENCLVVDCGTCIKYDLIDSEATYRGGNIAPGANMRIRAMHIFTAQLPEVPMLIPENEVGYSTETALQNGALRGAALEISGFVRLFEAQLNPLKVLLTGGDADFLAPLLPLETRHIEPYLTLYGLNYILQYNANQNFIP